jgi:hypothetical protein
MASEMAMASGKRCNGRLEWVCLLRAAVNPLRCAVRALRKPRVTIPGHPSNACVRPMDGFTAAGDPRAGRPAPRRMRTCPDPLDSRLAVTRYVAGTIFSGFVRLSFV